MTVIELRDQLNKLIEKGHKSTWVSVPFKETSGEFNFMPLKEVEVGDPGGWGNDIVAIIPVKELKMKDE